jgi:fibrillin 1
MDLADDMKTCVDYDPCLNSVDDSSCRNAVECEEGFAYNHDSETCEDINECLEEDKCQGGICENTMGSFKCLCHPGYKLSHNQSCVDIDECLENNGNCSHKCLNYPSTYACSCPFGQILLEDDHTCGFSDLCEPDNGGCAQICDYDEQKVFCSWYVFDFDSFGVNRNRTSFDTAH